MKKKIFVIALFALVAFSFSSCRKTCRCWTYYGTVDEFDVNELKEQGTSCLQMENFDFGLKYSLCEKVF